MRKEKFLRGLKIFVILILVMAITLLGFIQWKSDWIIGRVLSSVQSQLTDSLTYQAVHMDAFSHFPCVAVQLDQLQLGSNEMALIHQGEVDIVIRLFPLISGSIDIDRIIVKDAQIHIVFQEGRWSYDILKKSEGDAKSKAWKTLIHQLQINRSALFYSDGKKNEFELALNQALFEGKMDPESLDIELDVMASLNRLQMDEYALPEIFKFNLGGRYVFDFQNSIQKIANWVIRNDAIAIQVDGQIKREDDFEMVDLSGNWSVAKPEELKKWLPEKQRTSFKGYTFFGESEGKYEIKGKSSKTDAPDIKIEGKMMHGGFESTQPKAEVKNLNLDFTYVSRDPGHQKKTTLKFVADKKSTFGSDLKADVFIVDLDYPVMDLSLKGNIPAALINLFSGSTLVIESGEFEISDFQIDQFRFTDNAIQQLLEKGNVDLESKGISCTYLNNPITWKNAKLNSTAGSSMHLEFDALTWSNATAKDLKGDLTRQGDQIKFNFQSDFCGGNVNSKGTLTMAPQQHVFQADWVFKEIEMRTLLESFSNFDQTFITSENLSGKANLWAESTIPMDANWKIKENDVLVKSAIEIHDGHLKNLKTLEDFSDYVHVEDLREIHFNQLRNYLKIEDAKIYLPVMFIQSSAMNLSVGGIHGFDQKILYNLKLNAGQTIGNKLKKTDFRKELKPAAKSGWINMYFVLEGTTSNVRYQQYRTAVISGFEQSSQLKESLRNYLVDHFGYDVYWLEPNEWEDIPEYK